MISLKINIKSLIKIIVIIIIAASCCWFIYFLIKSSTSNPVEAMTWEAEINESLTSNVILAAETDNLKLYFQEDSAEFWIEDTMTQELWRSNPEKANEDKIAFGLNKSNILSQIIVGYIDSQSSAYVVNSNVGSVKEKTYEYKLADNGIYVTYYFSEMGFEIPVFYGLKDDYFTAKILCDQIVEHWTYDITNITLLPYMGSGSKEDDGYLVIPDGSGSIINFNNQKQNYLAYSQPVYGRDLALNTLSKTEEKEAIMMPVFGVKRNDYAMLGIITKGEYQAEIEAEVSGKSTLNNIVYSKVRFMQVETNKLFANSSNEQNSLMWSEQFNKFPEYEVRYYFLDKDATYIDMALRYQDYLVDEKGMTALSDETSEATKVNITLIGAVEKKDTFLGIPYDSIEVLTSYSEVAQIANNLEESADIDLNIWYTGFLKDGLTGKMPNKIRYDSRLGGKSSFIKAKDKLDRMDIGFYPSFNLVNMYQTGNGYYKTDSTRSVNRSAAFQYNYLLSTGERNSSQPPTYLLAPAKVFKLGEEFAKEIQKNNVTSIGLEGITNKVYSNFKKNGSSMNETGSILTDVISKIAANSKSLLLDKAYGYALPYADIITNTPVYSSGYDMTDKSIPFYQIVMSGYATLYSEPVNMQGNIKEYLLKLAETGVNPNFMLIAKDPTVLMNTDYAYLYAVGYEYWEEDIIETAEWFSKLSPTYGQRIIGHEEISSRVFKTSYDKGIIVYTNYNSSAVTIEGVAIEAKDFYVKGGK